MHEFLLTAAQTINLCLAQSSSKVSRVLRRLVTSMRNHESNKLISSQRTYTQEIGGLGSTSGREVSTRGVDSRRGGRWPIPKLGPAEGCKSSTEGANRFLDSITRSNHKQTRYRLQGKWRNKAHASLESSGTRFFFYIFVCLACLEGEGEASPRS